MEKELFPLKKSNFLFVEEGLFLREAFPSARFIIAEKIDAFWREDKIDDIKAKIFYYDHRNKGVLEREVSLKGKVSFPDFKLYLKGNLGYAVTFRYLPRGNNTPFYMHYFLEKVPEKREFLFKGGGAFEKTPYYFEIKAFYPDMVNINNSIPEAPGIKLLKIKKGDKLIGSYTVLPGQKILLERDEFMFTGVSLWTELVITKNEPLLLIYIGSLLMCLGALLFGIYYIVSLRESVK